MTGTRVTATYDNARFVRSAVDRLHKLGVDDDQIDIHDDEDFDIRVEEDLPDEAGTIGVPNRGGHRHPVLLVDVDTASADEPIEILVHAMRPGSVLIEEYPAAGAVADAETDAGG